MLKAEDLKTAYLKSEDCFMCWEPPGCRVYEFIVALVRYAQEIPIDSGSFIEKSLNRISVQFKS